MLAKLKQIFQPRKLNKDNVDKAKRYNDAVMIVRQDNAEKRLPIEALNFNALKLLGLESSEAVERDLRDYLPIALREVINDNLEFSTEQKEIDSVLNRIPNFRMKTKDGTEVPLKIRVIRSLSSLDNHRFQLVMNDSSLIESLTAHRENYRSNMQGHEIYDKETNLLTRDSVLKDIELISFYSERNDKESCYAVFKFINYDDLRIQHEDDGAMKLLVGLMNVIDSTKRNNDIVGIIDKGALIVIFPETPKENIKLPISRIVEKLPPEIKSELRIYYNSIKSNTSPDEQLSNCMKGLAGTY